MNKLEALQSPNAETLENWLNTPRLARCGEYFTPSDPIWNPDKSTDKKVNLQAAALSVPPDWRPWLHAALAYRMIEQAQSSVATFAYILSRAAKIGLNPLNENHLLDLREASRQSEFSALVSFMRFWNDCESLELRPSGTLIDAYENLPKKKRSTDDPVLSLDPEKGPFTQAEQNSLHQWLHEQFCHGHLDPEQYLYVRLMMIYGQRGAQLRMMVFDDFIQCEQAYKIRIHRAKQRNDDKSGFRAASETFNLDEDLYKTVRAYQAIVLAKLKQEYPNNANWDKAIRYVPLFRQKFEERGGNVNIPVMLDSPNHKMIEKAPQAVFHICSASVKQWLCDIQSMPKFPVSHRTGQPLKISRGHRFKHTLGTDLSNAGLDDWAIASALMHSNNRTVRKYRQVSAELMALIDEKMSDHLALVVNAFTGTIVKDRQSAKNGDRADRQIEDLAVCGADALCHLDTPFSCYACSKFQPLLGADHHAALERMERRRTQTLAADKTTGTIWERAILACRKVIIDCERLSKATSKEVEA